jgi:glutathione S-transferase
LNVLGLPFEHKPVVTFVQRHDIQVFNPLMRVPVLVLDQSKPPTHPDNALIESGAILDYLDQMVGAEKCLTPLSGASRTWSLQVSALATGVMDKAIAALYERRVDIRPVEKLHQAYIDICEEQVFSGLCALDRIAAAKKGLHYFAGDRIGQVDINAAVAFQFAHRACPSLASKLQSEVPALKQLSDHCSTLPAFLNAPLPPPA